MAESMLEVYMYVISSRSSLNILRTLLHTGINLDLETHGRCTMGVWIKYMYKYKRQNYVKIMLNYDWYIHHIYWSGTF